MGRTMLVPFDPRDPVAMLEAMRVAQAAKMSEQARKEAPVKYFSVLDERRLVPINLGRGKAMLDEAEAAERQQELAAREAAVGAAVAANAKEREAQPHRSFGEERAMLEERLGQHLLGKVMSIGAMLAKQFRAQVDACGTGYVSAAEFKEVMRKHASRLGLSAAQVDLITARLLQGDRVAYSCLSTSAGDSPTLGRHRQPDPDPHSGRAGGAARNMGKSQSAAELREGTLREAARERPLRYSNAAAKYHSTRRLLRPPTGAEGFFPDEKRFVTSTQRPPSVCRAARPAPGPAKSATLARHLDRLQHTRDADQADFEERARIKVESIRRQQQRYLAPLELQNRLGADLAAKRKGRRRFSLSKGYAHQLEQRLGEAESRAAYQVYEQRTRTDEWRSVFNIGKTVVLPQQIHN